MRKYITMAAVVLTVAATVGCSEKKSSTIIITKKKAEVRHQPSTRSMGDYTQTRTVTWLGSTYKVVSQLAADRSLPTAADGDTKYYDNRIHVRIVRKDGTDFFSRSFTKEFFRQYVAESYYAKGALLGIVYMGTEGNTMLFAASVGNPDKSSDEYVPLVMRVDNFGNVTVSKDTSLDTESSAAEEEEEGV